LTWTALDVGGPCVEAFEMNIRDGAPALLQSRELQEAALVPFKTGGISHAVGFLLPIETSKKPSTF
jgi:hypothetical protein